MIACAVRQDGREGLVIRYAVALVLVGLVARAQEPDGIERGRALLGGPEHEQGVALIRKSIEELSAGEPDADALHRIGCGWFYLEQDEKAVDALRRAVRLAPGEAHHHFMLGVVLLYSDLPAAEQALAKAAELDPRDSRAHFELGRARALQGKHDLALGSYLDACKADPEDPQARVQAGNLLAERGRHEEALEQYEKAVEIAPDHLSARYNAGQSAYNVKRFEKALRHWLAAAKIAPADFGVRRKIVQALYALERFPEAEPHRAKLFELRASSEVEELRTVEEFCFDQFDAGRLRVFAYERFEKEGDLYYHFVFKVVAPDGRIVRTVNLESSDALRALGWKYILGGDEKGVHSTYGPTWKELPDYRELRKLVVLAAQGKLEANASSTRD
jgi:tetratricopeptide (TPR) repeat protein